MAPASRSRPPPSGSPTHGRCVLCGVAIERRWFAVAHPSNRTRQCSSQRLGRRVGATDGELDLLVDLAGEAPRLILGPHEVRVLIGGFCCAVPGQGGGVSKCADVAREEQHCSIGDVHPWRLRSRLPSPAFPDSGVPLGARRGEFHKRRESDANGIGFILPSDPNLGIQEADAHIDIETWWAVANQIPPINVRTKQPPGWVRRGGRSHVRHAFSLAGKPPSTNAFGHPDENSSIGAVPVHPPGG
jgi:hypothetical protein